MSITNANGSVTDGKSMIDPASGLASFGRLVIRSRVGSTAVLTFTSGAFPELTLAYPARLQLCRPGSVVPSDEQADMTAPSRPTCPTFNAAIHKPQRPDRTGTIHV